EGTLRTVDLDPHRVLAAPRHPSRLEHNWRAAVQTGDHHCRVIHRDRADLRPAHTAESADALRNGPLLDEGVEQASDLREALLRDELREVDDVCADIAQGARARLLLVGPPRERRVSVAEPGLQVLRAYLAHLTDAAFADEVAGQLQRGYAPVGETDHEI